MGSTLLIRYDAFNYVGNPLESWVDFRDLTNQVNYYHHSRVELLKSGEWLVQVYGQGILVEYVAFGDPRPKYIKAVEKFLEKLNADDLRRL